MDHTRYVTLDLDDECIKGLRDDDADHDACGVEMCSLPLKNWSFGSGGLNDLNRGEAV